MGSLTCGAVGDLLADWLEDVRRDLAHPEKMRCPGAAGRDAEALDRLRSGVADGRVLVPDATARAVMEVAALAYDEASEYAEIVANHDALHGLLAALSVEAA